MAATYTFTSLSFQIVGATQISDSVVRIHYSAVPKQSSSVSSDDALNVLNYAVTGPIYIVLSSAASVAGEPYSIDLSFAQALSAGNWTFTVSNVENLAGTAIGAPTQASLEVTSSANATTLTAGAENDTPARVIRKHLNPALAGDNWDALIEALSVGDDYNWDNAQLAFDSMFRASANDKYLDRLASNDGVTRPNIGMSNELFRQLLVAYNNNKLTHDSLRRILEVFFGEDALRAYAETELAEPYVLADGLTLDIEVDQDSNQEYSITFEVADFGSIFEATAIEVANVLNKHFRQFERDSFAVAYTDYSTGDNKVRIYSGSLGPKSFIKVTGGTAQPFLRFPTHNDVYDGTVTSGDSYGWVYANPEEGVTTLTLTEATPAKVSLLDIVEGDYVVIGEDANSVEGSYEIAGVDFYYSGGNTVQRITINEDLGFTGTAVQDSNDAYTFFSPTLQSTLQSGKRVATITSTTAGVIDVRIPATTQAVNRDYTNAAYIKGNTAVDIVRYHRDDAGVVTVQTEAAHGLAVGDQIWMQVSAPDASVPFATPGIQASDVTGASFASFYSGSSNVPVQQNSYAGVAKLSDGTVVFHGGGNFTTNTYNDTEDTAYSVVVDAGVADTSGTEAEGSTKHTYTITALTASGTPRQYHTMTVLDTDQILVAGGYDSSGPTILASAQLYNPATDTWSSAGNMSTARHGHEAVKLQDGRVLVIGGATGTNTTTATAEIYDPALNTWSAADGMIWGGRYRFKAVLLSDGRVLAIGGSNLGNGGLAKTGDTVSNGGTLLNQCEIYDPNLNDWTDAGRMRYERAGFAAHVYDDGRILVFGGANRDASKALPTFTPGQEDYWPNESNNSAEIWNPETERWYPAPKMPKGLIDPITTTLSDGTIWVGGGYTYTVDYDAPSFSSADNYQSFLVDPDTLEWSVTPRVASNWRDSGSVAIEDVVVTAGGVNSAGTSYTNLDLWTRAAQSISGGGFNQPLSVASIISSTKFTVETPDYPFYTSNFSSVLGGTITTTAADASQMYNVYSSDIGFYDITTAVRTSNVTTLTLGSDNPFNVGDTVFVNINDTDYTSGLYTVTAVTATTISYAETGSNQVSGATTGSVSVQLEVPTLQTFAAVESSPIATNPGVYIYDPTSGLSISSIFTTTSTDIEQGSQSNVLTVTSTADFPDSEGYFILDFGGANQTAPIKYLEKISSTELLLDYRYEFQANFPSGTNVSYLTSRTPYVPEYPDDAGSFYVTGSTAGRIAAESFLEGAIAAGMTLNLDIAYPGDRGLGGEGYATEGDDKLSDIVEVYGEDDVG